MIDLNAGCAVVTGGSAGIGLALVRLLAAEGMNVVVVGRDLERAEVAAAEARAFGVRALGVSCDVSDRAAVFALADRVREEFGSVELLALNAGLTTAGELVDHHPDDWDWVTGTVLNGVANGIQAFGPALAAQGHGHVLITGSFVGLIPDYFLFHGPYATAKAAVTGLAMSVRPELEPHGVGVTLLIPAGVDTALSDSTFQRPAIVNGLLEAEGSPHPMKDIGPRPGAPEPSGPVTFRRPADVARRTFDGIQRDEAIVITHPQLRPAVVDYYERILEAFDAAEEAELLDQANATGS